MRVFKTELLILLKKVIISSDDNVDYMFFMPITAKAWRYIGYQPVYFLIASSLLVLKSDLIKFVISLTTKNGGEIYVIDKLILKKDPRFHGYYISAISQVCRLCPTIIDNVSDDTYIITSDSDMIPLKKLFFNKQDYSRAIHIFYGNAYRLKRYPMCYIGMKYRIWNLVTGVVKNKDKYFNIFSILSSGLRRNSDISTQWNYDLITITNRIMKSKYYQTAWKLLRTNITNPNFRPGIAGIPGHIANDRLDRSNWRYSNALVNNYALVHCFRKCYLKNSWVLTCKFLSLTLISDMVKYFDLYRNLFIKIKGGLEN